MMSEEHTPLHDTTFGYTFTDIQDEPGAEPPGPPLLSHNEANLLDNFFQDPNTLATGPFVKDYTSTGWMFSAQAPYEWHGDPNGGLPDARFQLVQAPNGGHLSGPYARQLIDHDRRGMARTTQDTYAAAVSRVGLDRVPPTSVITYNPLAEIPPHHTPDAHDTSNISPPKTKKNPEPSLLFGSDNAFQTSTYTAQYPIQLRDTQSTFITELELKHSTSHPTTRGPSPTPDTSRKRRKGNPGDSDDSADDRQAHKRRQRRAADAGHDDEQESSAAGPHLARVRTNSKSGSSGANHIDATSTSPSDAHFSRRSREDRQSFSSQKAGRENLSEEQKRNNHIQSEKKRRDLIKRGYDKLERLVPALRQGGLSKSQILEEAAAFMEGLRRDNDELKVLVDSLDAG